MSAILIIGYGNPLRSDDAIGWHATIALKALIQDDDVSIVTTQQLYPELAESVSAAEHVFFIDARADSIPGQIRIANLNSANKPIGPVDHHLTPEVLLSYAASLYGRAPDGLLISVSGSSFDYGESLTPPVQNTLPLVIKKITSLVHEVKRKQVA